MKTLRYILTLLVTFLTANAFAADLAPDELVKSTAQDVIQIVKQDKDIQAGDKHKIYALVDAKVLPHFNFNRMTQLAMGKNWRSASPEQRETLVREFRQLLVRTYSVSLSQYKNQTIEYKPLRMQPSDTDATVRTQVIQPGGQPIPIDYSMEKGPQGWKVYDISVDGVSLVTNYRGTFNEQIRQSGIDGLIKSLVEKNRTGESSSSGKATASPEKK